RTISLEIDTPAPGYLLMNDRYDPDYGREPDWKVFINDSAARIFRADYIFRGLALPSGRSSVKMQFEPLLYAWITPALAIYTEIATLLMVAIGAIRHWLVQSKRG